MKASDYRIEQVETITFNGVKQKLFRAYVLTDGGYVHIGQFIAPPRTARKNLWLIADATYMETA